MIVIETEDGEELEIAIVNGVVASGIALSAVSGKMLSQLMAQATPW